MSNPRIATVVSVAILLASCGREARGPGGEFYGQRDELRALEETVSAYMEHSGGAYPQLDTARPPTWLSSDEERHKLQVSGAWDADVHRLLKRPWHVMIDARAVGKKPSALLPGMHVFVVQDQTGTALYQALTNSGSLIRR